MSQRREGDEVQILSGVFEGRTTGTPIGILIENTDARSRDYEKIKDRFRPGHADYTYQQKYGFRDYRGGGRSSARETVMRVAAGAIARKYLAERLGVGISGYLSQIGPLRLEPVKRSRRRTTIRSSAPIRRACGARGPDLEDARRRAIRSARGHRHRDRRAARAGRAGVRPARRRSRARDDGHQRREGVEIGAGVARVAQRGSEHRDELTPDGFPDATTPAASSAASRPGQDVVVHVTFKPTSSIQVPGQTIDVAGNPVDVVTTGRHDPCVGLRATPIAEAMLAIVLMDHYLRHRGQNADVCRETPGFAARMHFAIRG